MPEEAVWGCQNLKKEKKASSRDGRRKANSEEGRKKKKASSRGGRRKANSEEGRYLFERAVFWQCT